MMRFIFAIFLLSMPIALLAQDSNDSVPTAATQEPATDYIEMPIFAIKTNLLYDLTTTFNLGIEFRIGKKTSIDIPVNYNPWTFKDNRKWKHIMVQPEFRLWTRETFVGHFFGLHAHYAFYNVGNLPHGLFSEYMSDHRFQGWALGAGLSYGYRWNFGDHWAMEATFGLGYAYLDYDKYECKTCGDLLANETKHYFGPTKVGLNLIYSFNKKKNLPEVQRPENIGVPAVVRKETKQITIYEPRFTVSYAMCEAESVKERTKSGKAYIDFEVNSSEILSHHKNNAAELRKLGALIKSVKGNPYATITGVTITGYASPDGMALRNQLVSERRALALRDWMIANYDIPNNLFTVYGAGEDWVGLDSLINTSPLSEKRQIQEIIRNMGIFEGRERKLMLLAKGGPYRWMRFNLFAKLRRVEYRIDYTVTPFTVEQGKNVLRTSPESLSLNELLLVAEAYAPGSEEFNSAMETAVSLYPYSDVANLNAAAAALDRKDIVSAARYLSRVKTHDAAYWNNAGILSFMRGDTENAAECFAKAQSLMESIIFRNSEELDKHERSKRGEDVGSAGI